MLPMKPKLRSVKNWSSKLKRDLVQHSQKFKPSTDLVNNPRFRREISSIVTQYVASTALRNTSMKWPAKKFVGLKNLVAKYVVEIAARDRFARAQLEMHRVRKMTQLPLGIKEVINKKFEKTEAIRERIAGIISDQKKMDELEKEIENLRSIVTQTRFP